MSGAVTVPSLMMMTLIIVSGESLARNRYYYCYYYCYYYNTHTHYYAHIHCY